MDYVNDAVMYAEDAMLMYAIDADGVSDATSLAQKTCLAYEAQGEDTRHSTLKHLG